MNKIDEEVIWDWGHPPVAENERMEALKPFVEATTMARQRVGLMCIEGRPATTYRRTNTAANWFSYTCAVNGIERLLSVFDRASPDPPREGEWYNLSAPWMTIEQWISLLAGKLA